MNGKRTVEERLDNVEARVDMVEDRLAHPERIVANGLVCLPLLAWDAVVGAGRFVWGLGKSLKKTPAPAPAHAAE